LFNTESSRIVWNVKCSSFCSVYIINELSSPSFLNKQNNFSRIASAEGVLSFNGETSNLQNIQNKLVVAVENFNSTSLTVKVTRREYLFPKFDANWAIWIVGFVLVSVGVLVAIGAISLWYVYFVVKESKTKNKFNFDHEAI
jgi:hypothetical protein